MNNLNKTIILSTLIFSSAILAVFDHPFEAFFMSLGFLSWIDNRKYFD